MENSKAGLALTLLAPRLLLTCDGSLTHEATARRCSHPSAAQQTRPTRHMEINQGNHKHRPKRFRSGLLPILSRKINLSLVFSPLCRVTSVADFSSL